MRRLSTIVRVSVATKCAVVIFRVKVSQGRGGCFTSLDGI